VICAISSLDKDENTKIIIITIWLK
jgi:hypothetical protein